VLFDPVAPAAAPLAAVLVTSLSYFNLCQAMISSDLV
jgi:hypothetical protein